MEPGTAADITRDLMYKVTPLIGLTITGGSSTILGNYNYLRTVGAATRAMLVQAAAEQLDVPESELTTEIRSSLPVTIDFESVTSKTALAT